MPSKREANSGRAVLMVRLARIAAAVGVEQIEGAGRRRDADHLAGRRLGRTLGLHDQGLLLADVEVEERFRAQLLDRDAAALERELAAAEPQVLGPHAD